MPKVSKPTLVITLLIAITSLTGILVGGIHAFDQWQIRQYEQDKRHRLTLIQQQPLMYAIYRHDVPAVRRLLDSGADPNAYCEGIGPEHVAESALMLAAEIGDARIVELLIKHGAKVNVVDGWGMTALDYAEDFHQWETARVLESNGARKTAD